MGGNHSRRTSGRRTSSSPRLEALEGRWYLSVSGSLGSGVPTVQADADSGVVQVGAAGGEPTFSSGGRTSQFDPGGVGDIRLRLDGGDDAARLSKDGTITIKGKD